MRYFVALNLPEPIRRDLLDATADLRQWSNLRWTGLGALHLTLRFFGDLSREEAAQVGAALPRALPRMKLRVDGIGSFPPRGAMRVIWAGISGDLQPLIGLASDCERAAGAAGLPKAARPFHPHVTLSRVLSPRGTGPLAKAITALSSTVRSEAFEPESATLYSSELSGRGASYTAVQMITAEA